MEWHILLRKLHTKLTLTRISPTSVAFPPISVIENIVIAAETNLNGSFVSGFQVILSAITVLQGNGPQV